MTTQARTRVTVRVADLAKQVQRTIDRLEAKQANVDNDYNEALTVWRGSVRTAVHDAERKLYEGDYSDVSSYYNGSGSIKLPTLEKEPQKADYSGQIERAKSDLAMLNIAAEATMVITSESVWSNYLG